MIKYPRTLHLPFSPGVNKDDRRFSNVSCFKGKSSLKRNWIVV